MVRIVRVVIKDMINLETVLNSLILNLEISSPTVTHTGRRMRVQVNSGGKINSGLDLPIGENVLEPGLRYDERTEVSAETGGQEKMPGDGAVHEIGEEIVLKPNNKYNKYKSIFQNNGGGIDRD